MARARRKPKPGWLQFLVAFFVTLAFLGVYVAVMRAFMDRAQVDVDTTADERDLVLLYVHLGVLAFTAIAGFAAGKWLNGLGVAYATLFLAVLAVSMVLMQVGSYRLACERGEDGIIRHWSCETGD